MAHTRKLTKKTAESEKLTLKRAEKIAAVEGLRVSPRLARLLGESAHMGAEERRAYIAASLTQTKS